MLITAATSSSDPVELAPRIVRDRAVVVAVGMVGLNVPRNAYYEKELELRLSRSYGPGRYDRRYEEEGVDYPIGYVRWTEQRNMEAFLDLVAEGSVRPARLVTHRFPIEDAERAYQVVTGETAEPSLGILLSYPAVRSDGRAEPSGRRARPRAGVPIAGRRLRLGVVGAGSFARAVLLPALRRLDERVELRGVATASGPSAQQTMARFGFAYASVDWRDVVHDPELDAVLIATRHDLHAEVAGEALRAGRSVLLEKPMALDDEQLSAVAVHVGGQPTRAPGRLQSPLLPDHSPAAGGLRGSARSARAAVPRQRRRRSRPAPGWSTRTRAADAWSARSATWSTRCSF